MTSDSGAVGSSRERSSAVPVRLRGVSKRYGSTVAVSELDLEVQATEVLALLGPNGAGKTTTVEMCEGFIKPDGGSIEILGLDPVADNARVRERIGVMLQGGGGYPAARADEMLNLVAAYAANPLDPQWLMNTLGLTEAARTTYRRLSGGQQQRLALACAVVGRPELVFLDEPTAGMDAHARIVVWELINGLRRDGVTVVLTTHQLTEAEELADRIVIIDHGVAVADRHARQDMMRSGAENQLRLSRRRGCWTSRCSCLRFPRMTRRPSGRRANISSRATSTLRCSRRSPRGARGSMCWPPTCASIDAASRTCSSI